MAAACRLSSTSWRTDSLRAAPLLDRRPRAARIKSSTAARSRSVAARKSAASPLPAKIADCASRSALPASPSSRIVFGWVRATWFTAQAATVGLRSAFTRAAPSRSPSLRRRFASSSRSRMKSSSGSP